MGEDVADLDDLVIGWTLVRDDWDLVAGKRGATRLWFALQLKFYGLHGRFAATAADIPSEAVELVAQQVDVAAEALDGYQWSGRTNRYHRAQIREHFGFSECTVADADRLTGWLTTAVCMGERDPERVMSELLARFRHERIEPPTDMRLDRMVRSALHNAELQLTTRVTDRLPAEARRALDALIGDDTAGLDDGVDSLALIKAAPGPASLDSLLTEIDRLDRVRSIGLPVDLFGGIAAGVVSGWRARVMVESPSHLWTHPENLRWTLLAALVHERDGEIIDSLVDLLIATVHRIGARADRRVTSQLTQAFKRVTGKENILFSIAQAAVEFPDDPVRQVVFPAVTGGEATLNDLVAEYKANGPTYRHTVQTTLKASYTNHYRRGLIRLIGVLEFRSNNERHRPVLDALDVVARHADSRTTYLPADEDVPTHRGLVGDWEALVFNDDGDRRRVVRSAYEICTFQALRDQLRCKEIWVVGANRWRNPGHDLPADFNTQRAVHYKRLGQPLDPAEFIDTLRDEMRSELDALDTAIPDLEWVDITERGRQGAIRLSPLAKVPEPTNLRALKAACADRWGVVPMIDMLKEAVLRSGCFDRVTSAATRGDLDPGVLAERLLLVIYAYGTNTGMKAVANGDHGHTENDLRYVRRRYLNAGIGQQIAVELANATFAARQPEVWGEGTGTVASDSTHLRALDQNLFTEWHARYGGRGVLIYWHVEKKSVAVHSQLISCSASEVAAMIEGAMRHGTEMRVQGNYVDSHGQSEIGFGITRLLGFKLLPRIKRINHVRLYRPDKGRPDAHPNLQAALTRPIRWDLIAEQYDQMIRYATAIRLGTASTEVILRRFMKANAQHPTYQAMIECGRAEKTIFVARYLRLRELQREVGAGMNVVESWHGGQDQLFFGNGGDIDSNNPAEQQLSVACLRILQSALVYINTLMIQEILQRPEWTNRLTDADHRGLTPLFWIHVSPYGEVRLNMNNRLDL